MTGKSVGKYPNLIIAGAPKSGTSSLFFWLGEHPEVCASKVKETYFLGDEVNRHNKGLNVHENGLDAYQNHFQDCENQRYRLEATPVYIYHKEPFRHLLKLSEVPKVIFILRAPQERLYSHYRFARYRTKNIKTTFEQFLDYENYAPKHWENYLKRTHYVNYIERWIDCVGKSNILVYQFEAMVRDQVSFMKNISNDLKIDDSFYNDFNFFHRNETRAIKSKWLHRLGLKLEPLVPTKIQEKLIPFYLRMNASGVPPISDEEKNLKNKVAEGYKASNEKLANLFPNMDLNLWKP